jgi:DNA-binding MarR family transcriptional regulator
MSRFDREERESRPELESDSRMSLSQGRGSGSGDSDEETRRLRDAIDRASAEKPSFTEFQERLEREGVRAVPSVQSNGRLNGMVYEVGARRIKGSSLGRAYTAYGLRDRKGVQLEPQRDPELRKRGEDGISPAQRDLLREVGTFRTVAVSDLARVKYESDDGALRQDLANLSEKGLIEHRTVSLDSHRRTLNVVTLTRRGKALLERSPERNEQAIHSGFVKPNEVAHDSALYRLYQAEAARIEAEGGRIHRVVLDYEFKRRVYSPLAKAHDLPAFEYARRQEEIAAANGLKVVEGRIALPDLRIEYETPEGELAKVDLELATPNYRAAHLSAKATAGFKVFVERTSAGAPAWDDHRVMAEILSF